MRKLLETVLSGLCAASMVAAAPLSDPLVKALEADTTASQRIIVMMKDAAGGRMHIRSLKGDRGSGIEAMKQNASLAQADLLKTVDSMGISGSADVQTNWLANAVILDATPEQIEALETRSDVEGIYLNQTIQLEPYVASEVPEGKKAQGDDDTSTWGLKAIRALEARQTYGVDGSGVVVGVLDTGYDGNHALLKGKMLRWKSFDGGNQPDPVDDNGHGSHVSGTIGGSNGGGMEIGVAPGVKFVFGKIFSGSGSATTEGILGAMAWVVDPDGVPNSGDEPRLVSNSWGGGMDTQDSPFWTATKAWVDLDIAPIFAAGNSGPSARTVGSPGGYPEAFAVAATTVNTSIASFSSRGPVKWNGSDIIKPDIAAPGKDVTSVKAGGQYWTISGTSMATPHVAGLAALLYQANPDLTVADLIAAIQDSSIDEGAEGKDNNWGEGRIDAMAALSIVISGGKLAGSIKDTDGNGIAHAKVTVNETGTQIRLAADGSFKMTVPEGNYTLAIEAFGFVSTSSNSLTVAAGEETSVDVVMDRAESGIVAGTLTGAGAPVQGTVTVLGTPLAAVESGADGSFSVALPAGSYEIAASAYGFDAGTSGNFTVVAGQTNELSIDLAKLPAVLVVDDDKGKNYEGFYTAALGDTAYNLMGYDQLKTHLSGNFLAQYEVVVWFTGMDYQGSLTAEDRTALTEYLDLGGRLFVSGQDLGYEIKATPFFGERLGAKFVKDTAGSTDVSGDGLSFSLKGGDGADNQKYPDSIQAASNGQLYMSYANDAGAAIRVEAGDSKVVYFGFGFEGINSAADRSAVMTKVMDFLKPSTAEMARRIDAVQARSTANANDQARLVDALTDLVSTRVQAEGSQGLGSSRSMRRLSAFEELND
jgi:subtilisin family serine protease